ncbi:hypothetical protein BC830DRAFT_1102688 [Chytriomyces sp. MP71]|nr:hypothetical protein BC830DRAFT_1102688 [Chytriomyces sp. MP71]
MQSKIVDWGETSRKCGPDTRAATALVHSGTLGLREKRADRAVHCARRVAHSVFPSRSQAQRTLCRFSAASRLLRVGGEDSKSNRVTNEGIFLHVFFVEGGFVLNNHAAMSRLSIAARLGVKEPTAESLNSQRTVEDGARAKDVRAQDDKTVAANSQSSSQRRQLQSHQKQNKRHRWERDDNLIVSLFDSDDEEFACQTISIPAPLVAVVSKSVSPDGDEVVDRGAEAKKANEIAPMQSPLYQQIHQKLSRNVSAEDRIHNVKYVRNMVEGPQITLQSEKVKNVNVKSSLAFNSTVEMPSVTSSPPPPPPPPPPIHLTRKKRARSPSPVSSKDLKLAGKPNGTLNSQESRATSHNCINTETVKRGESNQSSTFPAESGGTRSSSDHLPTLQERKEQPMTPSVPSTKQHRSDSGVRERKSSWELPSRPEPDASGRQHSTGVAPSKVSFAAVDGLRAAAPQGKALAAVVKVSAQDFKQPQQQHQQHQQQQSRINRDARDAIAAGARAHEHLSVQDRRAFKQQQQQGRTRDDRDARDLVIEGARLHEDPSVQGRRERYGVKERLVASNGVARTETETPILDYLESWSSRESMSSRHVDKKATLNISPLDRCERYAAREPSVLIGTERTKLEPPVVTAQRLSETDDRVSRSTANAVRQQGGQHIAGDYLVSKISVKKECEVSVSAAQPRRSIQIRNDQDEAGKEAHKTSEGGRFPIREQPSAKDALKTEAERVILTVHQRRERYAAQQASNNAMKEKPHVDDLKVRDLVDGTDQQRERYSSNVPGAQQESSLDRSRKASSQCVMGNSEAQHPSVRMAHVELVGPTTGDEPVVTPVIGGLHLKSGGNGSKGVSNNAESVSVLHEQGHHIPNSFCEENSVHREGPISASLPTRVLFDLQERQTSVGAHLKAKTNDGREVLSSAQEYKFSTGRDAHSQKHVQIHERSSSSVGLVQDGPQSRHLEQRKTYIDLVNEPRQPASPSPSNSRSASNHQQQNHTAQRNKITPVNNSIVLKASPPPPPPPPPLPKSTTHRQFSLSMAPPPAQGVRSIQPHAAPRHMTDGERQEYAEYSRKFWNCVSERIPPPAAPLFCMAQGAGYGYAVFKAPGGKVRNNVSVEVMIAADVKSGPAAKRARMEMASDTVCITFVAVLSHSN